MRVSSFAVARPAAYDRNASSVITADSTSYAPHAATVRGTYTVAAGKKLFVEVASTFLKIDSAPTSSGLATTLVRITNAAASFLDISRSDLMTSAAVSTVAFNSVSGQTTIYATETVSLITVNLSTGGFVLHAGGIKATLFDA